MSSSATPSVRLSSGDLNQLYGRIVLVKSTRDRRNPPTAMRGWIEVAKASSGAPEISIVVEFPQMFTTPAHHRTIPLNEAGLAQLLASERNGTFEFTIDDELV
jgi:hypothetical protein